MRRYELMLLLRPDLEEDKLQSAVEKVTRAIVNAGGALTKVSPWGKRRLAYDIKHHRDASYFLLHFDIDPSHVRELERGMLISEEILRHLVTVLEDRPGQSEDDLPDAVEPAAAFENGASPQAADATAAATEPAAAFENGASPQPADAAAATDAAAPAAPQDEAAEAASDVDAEPDAVPEDEREGATSDPS
ncbi:MAG: 30S ribosomal protein S6 [Chloroflexota bacterium]